MTTPTFPNQLRSVDKTSFGNDAERKAVIAEADALISRLETPFETLLRHAFVSPSLMATIDIAQNLGLFKQWHAAGGGPKAEVELRELVVCDANLFGRILRHLVAGRIITLTESGQFASTEISSGLADEKLAATARIYCQVNAPCFLSLPAYLKSINHASPASQAGNWSFVHGKDIWTWFKANAEADKTVGLTMSALSTYRAPFFEIFSAKDLIANSSGAEVLLVDVGGSLGHDLEAFIRTYPQSSGRLVLQDRQEVLQNADVHPGIKKMAHDLMLPNPIRGAAAYYFHTVLHDFPDDDVIKILGTLQPALKKGFSKVLVHETVVSMREPNLQATMQDMLMMAMCSAHERTEDEWRAVFRAAGYTISKIWHAPLSYESVIEAEIV